MLTDSLFEQVLVNPIGKYRPDTLLVASGFATASMANYHMGALKELSHAPSIRLIVGMAKSGIETAQHRAFVQLSKTDIRERKFSCRYITKGAPVHAKVYIWVKNEKPVAAFAGSANYTLTGFGKTQVEAVGAVDKHLAHEFYNKLLRRSVDCANAEGKITLLPTRRVKEDREETDSINLSMLVKRTGETHTAGGINWGQRENRDPNEAYIPFSANIRRSGFFPEKGRRFVVQTDDSEVFVMVVASGKGKVLETPDNNSLIGEYLRRRLGVASGEYVTREHFEKYGRTDITFTKVDDETYFMDFQPNP